MTSMEVRKAFERMVIEKGSPNKLLNRDLSAFIARTGCSFEQMYRTFNYFLYSKQTAKYRQ